MTIFINQKYLDVDECNHEKDACDTNQICTNEIGGFRCDCKIGFTLDPLTKACEGNKQVLAVKSCPNWLPLTFNYRREWMPNQ